MCSIVDCKDRCDGDATDCDYFVPEGESTELTLFQSKAMDVMQGIADLDRQKKMLEAQDKALRQKLQAAMDKYGVKKFENDILKITYVEPTTRENIDSMKLKEELPAVAAKYTKISQVKGSVRIEVK
jgi:hypothetical protein